MRDFPHKREDPRGFHNLEGETTVEDMARETPRIYTALGE